MISCHWTSISLNTSDCSDTFENESNHGFSAHGEKQSGSIKRTVSLEEEYHHLENLNSIIKDMTKRTIKAMENDRKALSREIHDSIGGSLSAIKMLLETRLQHSNGTPPNEFLSIEKIIHHLSKTIKESKRISYQMRSMVFDEVSLAVALSENIENFNEFYPQIQVDLQFHISNDDITDEIKTVIYRLVQEALNNVGKHSHANLVKITLSESKKLFLLSIEDNGCGFNVSNKLDPENALQGYGMQSMKERIELCKGSFTVKSEQGKGTLLLASVPKFIM